MSRYHNVNKKMYKNQRKFESLNGGAMFILLRTLIFSSTTSWCKKTYLRNSEIFQLKENIEEELIKSKSKHLTCEGYLF